MVATERKIGSLPYKIDYIGFVNNTGYGAAAKNTVNALACMPHSFDIKFTPVGGGMNRLRSYPQYIYDEMMRKPYDIDRVQIYHIIPDMHRRFKRNLCSIGVGVYETWEPPAHWVSILNQHDAVIVPSRFNRNIFIDAGVTSTIWMIPHCINMTSFCPDVYSVLPEKFSFLYFGSWRLRKGFKELLEAWVLAFNKCDNVKLVIKTDKVPEAQEYVRRLLKEYPDMASIVIDTQYLSDELVPSFIKSHHCMVCPTRGEGFGLPGLQSMALGVPLIITDVGGVAEYSAPNTVKLLYPEKRVRVKCMDSIPQFSNKEWAYVSPDQIVEALRDVFTSYDKALNKAELGGNYVRRHFGFSRMQDEFEKMLQNVVPVKNGSASQ